MIFIFLRDFVFSWRGAGIFFSGGDFGNPYQFVAFVKECLLLGAHNFDDRGTFDVIAFPIGHIIRDSWGRMVRAARGWAMDWTANASEIIGSWRFGIDAGNQ